MDDNPDTQRAQRANQSAPSADRAPDLNAQIASLARLLARQAAREHLHRLTHPDDEEATDEE